MGWFTNLLGPRVGTFIDAPRRPENGQITDNPYAPLLAESLAAIRARFHTWDFDPETKSIDPETATADQLGRALDDCWRCGAVEYPETEQGTYYAMKRADVLREAMRRRFPDQVKDIETLAHKAAGRASRIAHPR